MKKSIKKKQKYLLFPFASKLTILYSYQEIISFFHSFSFDQLRDNSRQIQSIFYQNNKCNPIMLLFKMPKLQKNCQQQQNDPFLIIKNYRKMVNRGVRLHKKRKQKFYPPSNIRTRRMEIRQKEISQVDHFLNQQFDSEFYNSYHDLPMEEQSLEINLFDDAKQNCESQQICEPQQKEIKTEWQNMDVDNLFLVNSTQFNDNFLLETN